MAGLAPAINVFFVAIGKKDVDARHKAGGFGEFLAGIFAVGQAGAIWGLRSGTT